MSKVLIWLVVIQPLIDGVTAFARYYEIDSIDRLTLLYRILVIGFFIPVAIRSKRNGPLLIGASLLAAYGISVLLIGSSLLNCDITTISGSLLLLIKMLYIFLLYSGLCVLVEEGTLDEVGLSRLFIAIAAPYAVTIIIGSIADIPWMATYNKDYSRFGTKGLFLAGNEASMAMFLFLAFIATSPSTHILTRSLFLFLVIIAALLLGTKAAIISLVTVFFIYIICDWHWKRGLAFALAVGLCLGIALYTLPNAHEKIMATTEYFTYQHEHVSRSSFDTLFSGRLAKLDAVNSDITSNSYWLWVVGGYVPIYSYMTEMDFFDLSALIGVIGVGYYMFLYWGIWRHAWLQSDDPIVRKMVMLFYGSFLLLAASGGHFFFSAASASFIAIFLLQLRVRGENWGAESIQIPFSPSNR
jgi:hypothetical protein